MGITAKELAKRLNLSAATVSMVLNNKPGISTKTRKLVIREAEKYGYDFGRVSLKKKSGSIYCIFYRTHNAILNYKPIFSEITDGIERECRKEGYCLKTMHIYAEKDNISNYIDELKISKCDGILFFGTEITASALEPFLQLTLPVILLDSFFDLAECSSVLINNAQGAYQATNYLIARCGCQPGYLHSSYKIENFEERKNGFYRAIKEHGLSTGNSPVHELAPSIEGAFSDMLELIDSGSKLAKCYFADNDLIAIGAIKALRLRSFKIPDDIAVIGFDNISEGKIIEPSLTTVDVPRNFMGQIAARQLIQQIADPVPHTVKIAVSTSIVKRFSA